VLSDTPLLFIAGLAAALVYAIDAAAQTSDIAPCRAEHYRAPASASETARLAEQLEADVKLAYQAGDTDLALVMLCRGAAAGLPLAETMIGAVTANGQLSVKRDPAQARVWLRRAASRDYPRAQLLLANMYLEAEGGPASIEEGIRLLEAAARSGLANAQFLYGMEFVLGRYVPKNLDAATHWLRAARDGGESHAEKVLSDLEQRRGR
jgi:TPR repeat protein